jgi:hypothetical protein
MPACSPTPFPEQLDKVTAKNTIQIERMTQALLISMADFGNILL